MSDELKLKHNENKKLSEWNKSLFSYLYYGHFNLRLSSFTFKRDKMHLVARICMWKFGQISPSKSNLGLILISIKNCANIHECLMSF